MKWLFTSIFAISIILLLIIFIQLCRDSICIVHCDEGINTTTTTAATTAASKTDTMLGSNVAINNLRNKYCDGYNNAVGTSDGISMDRSKVTARAHDRDNDVVSRHTRIMMMMMMTMVKVMMMLSIALLFFAMRMGTFRLIFEGE